MSNNTCGNAFSFKFLLLLIEYWMIQYPYLNKKVEFLSILFQPHPHTPSVGALLARLLCPGDELGRLWLRRHPAPYLHEPFRK